MHQEETPHEPTSKPRIDANQSNSRNSTGPRTAEGKAAVSRNAFKHGLSSRTMSFGSDEERTEFDQFLEDLRGDLNPCGVVEDLLVFEIALSWRKLQIAEHRLTPELDSGDKAVTEILNACAASSGIEAAGTSTRLDCTGLIVRVGRKNPDFTRMESDDGRPQVEYLAKIGTRAETLLRYQTAWRKDLYHALQTLKDLQESRRAKREVA